MLIYGSKDAELKSPRYLSGNNIEYIEDQSGSVGSRSLFLMQA
jgi:hypothetical protein